MQKGHNQRRRGRRWSSVPGLGQLAPRERPRGAVILLVLGSFRRAEYDLVVYLHVLAGNAPGPAAVCPAWQPVVGIGAGSLFNAIRQLAIFPSHPLMREGASQVYFSLPRVPGLFKTRGDAERFPRRRRGRGHFNAGDQKELLPQRLLRRAITGETVPGGLAHYCLGELHNAESDADR